MPVVLCEVEQRVARLTLHRPERLNAWTREMALELYRALAELDERDDVRAIVVTGAGRAFCAGADLSGGGSTFASERAWQVARELEERTRPWNMRTPVIGAINGAAVGIGATLPLSWDFRLASERAKLGFVFTRRGILPEAGSTWFLPRLVGTEKALELLITGRLIDAREALALGVVGRVVSHDELLPAAMELGREIADSTAPVSVALTKQLVWRQLSEPDPTRAKALEDRWFDWIGTQPDAAEGVESFLEKRPPRFSMKLADIPVELWEKDPGDD